MSTTPDISKEMEQWERVVYERLYTYIPIAKAFWENIKDLDVRKVGVYPIENGNGMMYRTSRAASRSPINGIQAFPFLPADELRLAVVPGGYKRMIKKVVGSDMVIDGMKIVEVENCMNTYCRGMLIAFVPVEKMELRWEKWMYINREEAWALSRGEVPPTIQKKAKAWVKEMVNGKRSNRNVLLQKRKG